MILVGLTGGIGSGKTTIAQIFQILGTPVYYSDIRAKSLMNTNTKLKNQIIDVFGNQTYLPNGEINRTFLAEIVFADKKKLSELNNIVHPIVRQDFIEWATKQKNAYVINESAILIESGFYEHMDKLICVLADEKLRIQRTVSRDKTSPKQIMERLNNQTTDDIRRLHADYIIENNNNIITNQVIKIDRELWEISRNG